MTLLREHRIETESAGAPIELPVAQHRSGRAIRRGQIIRRLLRQPGALIAAAIVGFVLLSAAWPSLFTSIDPTDTHPERKLQAPSFAHLFGTDELGRDLFTRVLHGGALTISAALIAVLIAAVFGLTIGVISGFAGGVTDAVLMRAVDVMLAIPGLLLALAIVTAIGFGTYPIAIAVGIGIIPGFARTTRAEVLRVKTLPYIEAARTSGARRGSILLRHVLPNSSGPVAVLAILDFGAAIVLVASLSFLGFGAAPPAAEWGTLISLGRNYLVSAPWLSLVPGLFVALFVLSLNHLARSVEEVSR